MVADIFNVNKQFAFYGSYHTNKYNVAIHLVFVPLILWTAQVMLVNAPLLGILPSFSYKINNYLTAEANWASFGALLYWLYYLALEPTAALLYLPQLSLSTLSSAAFARNVPDHNQYALALHVCSWIAQFIGHGVAEGRAPALLDNLLASVVLAPFFVHLEILFGLGYRPALHKRIQNAIGVEVTRIRTAEGAKKRESIAAKIDGAKKDL